MKINMFLRIQRLVYVSSTMPGATVPYVRSVMRRLAGNLQVCFLALLLVAPGAVRAQIAGTGTIQGTVSDATGAVISNAAVTLTETSTQVARIAKADGSGLYVFPNIEIGTYSVKVTSAGFKAFTESNVVLEVGSNISINVKMTVGTESQNVEVRSEGLALQTEDSAYKQTIDSTELMEMPLNGRNMTGLLQFAGGTVTTGSGDFAGSKYSYAAGGFSLAGGMGNDTLWRLDGGDNSDYMAGANLPLPFPDAVAQFSVESSVLGAGEGQHAGGMVNVVTRSGTNQFHGDAFEFIRNNFIDSIAFNAQPCAAGVSPGPSCGKDTLHQNQFGGTIGGPVWFPKLYNGKNRLFFFAGFQYSEYKAETANSSGYVPTAANILHGDFTQEVGAPVTSGPGSPGTGSVAGSPPNPICASIGGFKLTQLVDPLTGAALLGNVYPSVPTWNPQSLALLSHYPYTSATAYTLPAITDGSDVCGHFIYSIPNQNFDKQFITRIDYTLGGNDHLYGRYMLDSYQLPAYFYPNNIAVTTFSGNPEQRVQTETIGEDHTFTSNLVNSAHITAMRRLNERGYNLSDINPCDIGVTMICAVSAGFYLGNGGQDSIPSLGGGTNSLSHFNDNTLAIDDDVTWLHGKHQIVFGGEYVRNQLNVSNAYDSNGNLGFNSNYSEYGPYGSQNQTALNGNYCSSCAKQLAQLGDAQLDFLQGAMHSFDQSKQEQNALRTPQPSLYIQDTFHATKQLTLVAGMRWQPNFQPHDVFNRGEDFNYTDFINNVHSSVYPTAPAGMLFYGDPGVLNTFMNNQPNQWDPNLGITYDPVGDGKTVLRAGVEYMYDLPNTFTTQRNNQNPPFATDVAQGLNSYIPFSNPWSAPTLPANSGPGATITGTSIASNPFPTGSAFTGLPPAGCTTGVLPCAVFPNNSQYIVPIANFHAAAYAMWTASVQHDFGAGWIVSLSYIGSKGDHEPWDARLNGSIYIPGLSTGTAGPANCNTTVNGVNYWLGEFPGISAAVPAANAPCSTTGNETQRSALILANPAQGNLIGSVNSSQYVSSTAISTYEGMVFSVNHRLSSTFSLLANYTWSKCLDELDGNGDYSGVSGMDPNIPRLDYGPCGFDLRNVAAFAPIVKTAFHFDNHVESLILNGWEVSGLSKITTGSNFSVTTGADDDEIGNPSSDRATRIPGIPLYAKVPFRFLGGAAYKQYLNPAAFQTSGSYYSAWEATTGNPGTGYIVYGNTGRNAFHNPPVINFDAQLTRIWHLYENLNMTTRIEAYNVLNHPNFSGTQGNVTNGSFGQVGNPGSERQFQGVIKFIF